MTDTFSNSQRRLSYANLPHPFIIGLAAYKGWWWLVAGLSALLLCIIADEIIRKVGK